MTEQTRINISVLLSVMMESSTDSNMYDHTKSSGVWKGVEMVKYKLIIDKNAEEEIRVVAHAPSALTEQIENLVRSFSGADSIVGYREDEMRKLMFREIECITILNRKVTAIDAYGNHYRIQERLRDLEVILPVYFVRINKSALANEHCILRFDAAFSGGVDAVFRCGYREYVSRRCFAEIRRRFEGI
ncbi:MAG: LytTR family transcriptional regulator [Anaerotignum sp.]|nr:LytTR family transcriptional regulator [Anaerotignum sp.]